MNFKALITALVLAATSTAALADPMVRDHRDQPAQTQVVRNQRMDTAMFRNPWRLITSTRTLQNGQTYLGAKATASKLQIVPVAGAADLQRIVVKFANGSIQNVKLGDQRVTVGRPLTIDLDGGVRNVISVVVYTKNARHASIELRAA